MSTVPPTNYRVSLGGDKVPVHPSRLEEAQELDINGDHYVSDKEIAKAYELKDEHGVDVRGQLHETKLSLAKLPNPDAKAYHSYQEVSQTLHKMEMEHPDLCERVSLGKTAQGRHIWALRITEGVGQEQPFQKTGIVITGCHHAREWMSVEIPLHTAQFMLEDQSPEGKARLANSETWFVPLVNPDGYGYSRKYDNMWRKNRHNIEMTVDGQKVDGVGVDPNRNYGDHVRAHKHFYRTEKDKPGRTDDDFEQGNDDPKSDVFRGLGEASEAEVQALLKLELGHESIKGGLDYHGYGETVMYPWGNTRRHPKGEAELAAICQDFNEAAGGDLKVQQSVGMYPALGGSNDIQYANGIVGLTVETNGCFQPDPSLIQPTCQRYTAGNLAFIDDIVERDQAGTLPKRSVPPYWREAAENG